MQINVGNKTSNKDNHNKLSKQKFFTLYRILAITSLLAVVIFELALIQLNVLPAKYLLGALSILTLLGVIVFIGLFFNFVKKAPKIISVGVSIILIVLSLIGTSYVTGTMNFLDNISSTGETVKYETYNVIVNANSEYEVVTELNESDVGIYSIPNVNYSTARNELKKQIECEYKSVDDINTLGNNLLEGKYESILISDTNYTVLNENNEGYIDKTKIIYSIDVKIVNKDTVKRTGVTEESFNIYVSGIDCYGSINKVSRSDVNMIVTVNPKTNKILLTSIPRDCVVTLPSFNQTDKLTHSGIYGESESIGAIENLIGIKINYYIKVNFSSVEGLVNSIGGIDVYSDYSFKTSNYYFTKGTNHMNGKQALAFSRERHSFSRGDFQRVLNQQKVIEAIISKVSSSSTLLLNYNSILGAVENSMDTNISPNEIKSLVKMQINDMPSWEFEQSSIDQGSDAMLTGYSYQYQKLYMFIPNENAIIEAEDTINAVMNEE